MASKKTRTRKTSKAKTKSRTKRQKQSPQLMQSFRFTIEAIGPRPDKRRLQKIINDARGQALRQFSGSKPKKAAVETPGGLLGFGAEVVYILHLAWPYIHAAGAWVATGAATEAGKQLFKVFADELRKRNIRPSEPEVSTAEVKNGGKTETEKKSDKPSSNQ